MLKVNLRHSFTKKSGGFSLSVDFSTNCQKLALFGPSGSGKTLTLNALAGLFLPNDGHISIGGKTLYNTDDDKCLPARERNIGYVFQDYALFPHLTVRENIAFPFRNKKRKSQAVNDKIDALLEKFELEDLADHYPQHISGGQKQRTALARALIFKPSLLLMDEPFSALDSLLRARVRRECAKMLSTMEIPTIIITHDPADVVAFAESVILYDQGLASEPVPLTEMYKKGSNGNPLVESLILAAKTSPEVLAAAG